MKKSTKFRNTLKPIITTLSVMALCCSTMSYSKGWTNGLYWGFNSGLENEAIEFDAAVTKLSEYFQENLIAKEKTPALYRVRHDVKQHHFQGQQIDLMRDVLAELKAINQKLADISSKPAPERVHQRFKGLSEEINDFTMLESGGVVHMVGDIAFTPTDKGEMEKLFKIQNPRLPENLAELRRLAEFINNSDSDSNEAAKLPVGKVKETPKSMMGEAIANYYTSQLEKQKALFAKNWITELAMKPKLKAMDDYYIDSNGLKKPKIRAPDIKSSNCGINVVLPSYFNFMSSDERIALAQEIFNRTSFQDDMVALIKKEVAKKITPLPMEQSQSSDGYTAIDYFTGGIVKQGDTYVKHSEINEPLSVAEKANERLWVCRSC